MTAETVYEVFKGLSQVEMERFHVLFNENAKPKYVVNKQTTKKLKYTRNDAIQHLLKTAFKVKSTS